MPYKKTELSLEIFSGLDDGADTLPVTYSDGFFLRGAEKENAELALLSAAFASLIYRGELPLGDAFFDMGFKVGCHRNYSPSGREGNTVAFTIGYKTAKIAGKVVKILAVAVRGTVGSEWYSNYNIGSGADNSFHEGFLQAGTDLLSELLRFYVRNEFNKVETKFWITGHSRGAAVANYVAGKLTETGLCASPGDIYAYTFATPAIARITEGGVPSRLPQYANIRNYLYSGDIVPRVPPESGLWGYSRYGVDISLDSASPDMLAVMEEFAKLFGYPPEPLNRADAEGFARILRTLVPTPAMAGLPVYKNFVDYVSAMQSGNAAPISGNAFVNALIDKGTDFSTKGVRHAHCCALYLSWMMKRAADAAAKKQKRK